MKDILRTASLILAILALCNTAFCQKGKSKDSRKSTTKDVQVFGEENEDYFKGGGKAEVHNIIKINPSIAIGGDFPIFYERVLNKHFAFEGSLGLTLRPRYAWGLYDIFADNFEEDLFYLTPKIGYLAGAEIKYYASNNDYAPEGFYMSAGLRYKKYNATSLAFDAYGVQNESLPPINTPTKVVDFLRMTAGYGILNDNFFMDWYFGFALKQKNRTFNRSYLNEQTLLIENQLSVEKKTIPALLFGFKMGVAF